MKRKTNYLEWEHFLAFLAHLKGHKLRLLFAIQGYCGLRVGDTLKLKWEDILNKNQIDIIEEKTGKHRTVYLNKDIIAMIKQEYKGQSPTLYVFRGNNKNKAVSIEYVNRTLKKMFIDNGIDCSGNISSHLFRKTFGRRVMDVDNWSDKSLVLLNEIYGHATISTTKIYLGIRQEEIKNVYHSLV